MFVVAKVNKQFDKNKEIYGKKYYFFLRFAHAAII